MSNAHQQRPLLSSSKLHKLALDEKGQLLYRYLNRYFPLPKPETDSIISFSAIFFNSSDALDLFISSARITSALPKII